MRSLLTALMLMASASFALAQEKPDTTDDTPKKELSPREQEFADLQKEMSKENQDLYQTFIKEKDEEKKAEIRKQGMALPQKYATKFLALAAKDPKDKVALEAASEVLVNGTKEQAATALDIIQEHHIESAGMKDIVPALAMADSEAVEPLLRKILDKNPSKEVQGLAAMTLATRMIEQADELDAEKAKPKLADAEQLLSRIETEFSKVEGPRGETLGEQAKDMLYALKNLAVGKKLPNLEGENLDGKTEKLSDYEGKVVVLDIWATWCPPCRAMIPHENEMVKELKDKPFALISISADAKKDTLTDFIEKTPMPWNHWWNGAQGKLLEKLNIKFFPTIYVLDAKGVIRYKNIRGEKLEEAVKGLIEEAGKKAGE